MAEQRLILVSDFDGTVYRGDAPVRHFARRLATSVPTAGVVPFLDAFEHYPAAGVAAAEASTDPAEAKVLRDAHDAWGAAQGLAALRGVGAAAVQDAFVSSRHYMLDDVCDLDVVEPLVQEYAALRAGGVRVVLATNSPAEGLGPLLARMALADAFDEVLAGAGKPEGLRRWLAGVLAEVPPSRLFSLGDHYPNEIEPAAALGAATGFINRFGRPDGPATAVGDRAEDLIPALRSWAAAAA